MRITILLLVLTSGCLIPTSTPTRQDTSGGSPPFVLHYDRDQDANSGDANDDAGIDAGTEACTCPDWDAYYQPCLLLPDGGLPFTDGSEEQCQ